MEVNAFTAGMAALFSDENLGTDALYMSERGWPAAHCRIIWRTPTGLIDSFGSTRVSSERAFLDMIQTDLIGKPRKGGILTIQEQEWFIEDVASDAQNIRWHMTLTRGV